MVIEANNEQARKLGTGNKASIKYASVNESIPVVCS